MTHKLPLRIAIFGLAGNPPTRAHREMAEIADRSGLFREIVIVPRGVGGKLSLDEVAPEDRAIMAEIVFMDPDWKESLKTPLQIDRHDVYGINTPTVRLLEEIAAHYPSDTAIYFVIGADNLMPQSGLGGKCALESQWVDGERLLRETKFFVIPRQGCPHPVTFIHVPDRIVAREYPATPASSTMVRKAIQAGEPWEHLVDPDVARYIKEKRLYHV